MIVLDTHVLAWMAVGERRIIVACALENRAALVTADETLLVWPHALVRHDARI